MLDVECSMFDVFFNLLILIFHSLHPLERAAGAQPAVHKRIQIAVHHPLHIARFHAGAQILHHAIGLEDVAANLVAPGNAALLAVKPFHVGLLRVHPLRVNPRQQQPHGRRAVLMLRTLGLRRDDQPGRNVRDAHGGLDLVHVLAALAAGTERVHLEFSRRNHDVGIALLDFRNRVHAGETRVPAFVGVERRDAHQPVHAAFGLGKAVGVFALKQHGDALEARAFAGQRVGDLDLPAARFGPALIHARQHFRPVLRLGAAGAGVDAEDAILPVVRAAQENLQFQRVEFLEKFLRGRG